MERNESMESLYRRKSVRAYTDEPAPEELKRAVLEDRAGNKGFEAWVQAFCDRKYNSDFSREMTRSAERYLVDLGKREENL